MPTSPGNLNKRRRFLTVNPHCYLCDGQKLATTIDHVPPRACFPDGYAPEGFEFPACKACNQNANKHDQVFGFYALLLDFDESKMQRPEYRAKIKKLEQGIRNNYAEALPHRDRTAPVYGIGSLYAPSPVAISVQTPLALKEALDVVGKKLTHALYLKETGNRLTKAHSFLSSPYQPQQGGTQALTEFFASLLSHQTIARRSNIRDYGEWFRYIFDFKPEYDFFVYAAQFGQGIKVWGIVRGSVVPVPEDEPLRSALWISGACGIGAAAVKTVPEPMCLAKSGGLTV